MSRKEVGRSDDEGRWEEFVKGGGRSECTYLSIRDAFAFFIHTLELRVICTV